MLKTLLKVLKTLKFKEFKKELCPNVFTER